MKKGSFIIGGTTSESLHAFIQSRPLIEAPLRKVEHKEIYGADGSMPIDEGAYGNTNMELMMFIEGDNLIADRQAFYAAFDGRGSYKEFIPYFDPDKIYRVMLSEKVQFENKYFFGEKQATSVKLIVKPYKYLRNSPPVNIFNNTKHYITNPTNYDSQPLITIIGSGPMTITVNGKPFLIKNVADTITLDCEKYLAYKEFASGTLERMNHQVGSREYPVFKPGVNDITVTGNFEVVQVKPRWRSLL